MQSSRASSPTASGVRCCARGPTSPSSRERTRTFDLDGFAGAGHSTRTACDGVHLELKTRWNAPFLAEPGVEDAWTPPYVARAPTKRGDGSLSRTTANGVYDVTWEGKELVVALAFWSEGTCNHFHFWVLAPQRETAEAFVVAVCRFGHAPRQEILVVNGERWKKDPELHAAIRASSFDDLVLPAELRREIVDDFTTFLAGRQDYALLGVPWKRGVLFLGPPGNGKTHCLRAVLGLLDLPTLYVQSFRSRYDTDERNIDEIFDRARRIAPCALVFEDLDAQITPETAPSFSTSWTASPRMRACSCSRPPTIPIASTRPSSNARVASIESTTSPCPRPRVARPSSGVGQSASTRTSSSPPISSRPSSSRRTASRSPT